MEHVNTFKGLNRDDAIENYPPGAYYDAQNIRILENEELTSGNVTNSKGHDFGYTFPSTRVILGECDLRDKHIIFSIDTVSNIEYINYVVEGSALISTVYHTVNDPGSLGFSTSFPITVIGRYESESVQKIYWIDNNYKSLRMMNIVETDIQDKSPEYFDIVPSVSFSAPKILATGSGSLKAGVIQYAYQLFREEGAESSFSPATKLVHLSNSSDTATTDRQYVGAVKDTEVGKAVKFQLNDLDTTNFDSIRIVSIFYDSLLGEPEINIIYEGDFNSTMVYTDGGTTSLGTYTLEEFRLFGSTVFTGKTLTAKDDILFVGNIKEDNFDVDYDARAYRFINWDEISSGDNTTSTSIGTGAKSFTIGTNLDRFSAWATAGSEVIIRTTASGTTNYMVGNITGYADSTGLLNVNVTEAHGSGTFSSWTIILNNYAVCTLNQANGGSSYVVRTAAPGYVSDLVWTGPGGISDTGLDTLPEGIDAINPSNSTTLQDTTYGRIYGESNVGGLGANVEYAIKIHQTLIDSVVDTSYYTGVLESKSSATETPPTTQQNFSFTTHASPVQVKGFQRDEVYRFGVVLFDTKGRSSFVKWIGDIRMPKNEDTQVNGDVTYYNNSGDSQYDFNYVCSRVDISQGSRAVTMANHLYIEFTLNNLPTDENGDEYRYQIVYVKREDTDKTVLAHGLWGGLKTKSQSDTTGNNSNYKPRPFWFSSTGQGGFGRVKNIGVYSQFISPEINFNKVTGINTGDYLIPSGYYTDAVVDMNIDKTETDAYTVNNNGETQDRKVTSVQYKIGPQTILSKRINQADYPVYNYNTDGYIIKYPIAESKVLSPNEVWGGPVSGISYQNRSVNDVGLDVDGETQYQWAYGGTSLFLNTGTSAPVNAWGATGYSTHWGLTGDEGLLVYLKRTLATQYGGNSNSSRQYNEYIPCTEISNSSKAYAMDGDTFICYFDHLKHMYSETLDKAIGYDSFQESIQFPVETSINLNLRHDIHVNKVGYNKAVKMNEANEKDVDFEETGPLYQYNDVYSKVNDSVLYFPKPSNWTSETRFDRRVKHSDVKIDRDTSDGWTKFRPGNFKDVENQYGELNKLTVFNNQLVYFQEKAFGILAVNERELINSSNIGALTLGTGGVLDRFDYVSTLTGTLHQWSVLVTIFGMFWYDYYNNELYKWTGSGAPKPLFTTGKIKSFAKSKSFRKEDSPYEQKSVLTAYDPDFKEVLFTNLYNPSNSNNFTVGYSCTEDVFTSFYSFKPIRYFNIDSKLYSVSEVNNNVVYKHNVHEDPGYYNNTYYDSYITLIVNPNPVTNKVFNIIEFDSQFNYNTTYGSGIIQDKVFTSLQAWNSYQDTGVITLDSSKITRKWRKWRINTLRDSLESGKEPRMRDTHLYVKFLFENGSGSSANEFRLKPVTTKYNVVPR